MIRNEKIREIWEEIQSREAQGDVEYYPTTEEDLARIEEVLTAAPKQPTPEEAFEAGIDFATEQETAGTSTPSRTRKQGYADYLKSKEKTE